MRIMNLAGEELPELQGVGSVSDDVLAMCRDILNDGSLSDITKAARVRGAPAGDAIKAMIAGDTSLLTELHNQEPFLAVLDPSQQLLAYDLCELQIGPAPGTEIPLIVPVQAKNKRWYYMGSRSEIPLEVAFQVDQNGNVAGLANFVHRTPKSYGASLTPEEAAEAAEKQREREAVKAG